MLLCTFSGLTGRAELAQASTLRLVGGALFVDGEGRPAAVHREHQWEFRGVCYTRFDIPGPVTIRLAPDGGPVTVLEDANVWFADGVLYAPGDTIARLDETDHTWRSRTGASYREIVIESRTTP